jgi:hypothetical protein
VTSPTTIVQDAIARVIATAIDGHIFAAGVTAAVTGAEPLVVPLADDFSEAGFPFVTVTMSPWTNLAQPGNARKHRDVLCAVWRERVPLGPNVAALYADCDAIGDAFVAHSKAFLAEPTLQSAILIGGPGIVERSVGDPSAPRMLLTLPFTVQVVLNQSVVFQPA